MEVLIAFGIGFGIGSFIVWKNDLTAGEGFIALKAKAKKKIKEWLGNE